MRLKYLVTGAAGHLGNTIVNQLLDQQQLVRVLVLPGEKVQFRNEVEIYYGDVCDHHSLEDFFNVEAPQSTIVIHCAGIISIKTRHQPKLKAVNVEGTKNIVDYCRRLKIKKMIYVSSVHAIPELPNHGVMVETDQFNPDLVTGHYAKSKAEATAIVLAASHQGLDVSVVHPSGIAGPLDFGHGHLTTLVEDYCHHRLLAGIAGGYDFVDVRDVAQGIISCSIKGKPGECYILSNQYYQVTELLAMLYEITGLYKIRITIPIWMIKLTAPLAEYYYHLKKQTPLYTPYSVYTLTANAYFSNAKARSELDFQPRPMMETLTDTVEWLKQQNRI